MKHTGKLESRKRGERLAGLGARKEVDSEGDWRRWWKRSLRHQTLEPRAHYSIFKFIGLLTNLLTYTMSLLAKR